MRAPSSAWGKSWAYHSTRSPFRTFDATKPAMFTGSFADPNGGAYASSSDLEIVHRRAQPDAGGEHVESLVHPVEAGDLRAQDDAGRGANSTFMCIGAVPG